MTLLKEKFQNKNIEDNYKLEEEDPSQPKDIPINKNHPPDKS